MFKLTVAALLAFLSLIVYAQKPQQREILDSFNNKESIGYKTIDGRELDMFILYPDSIPDNSKLPWMLHVHGGGWSGGNKYAIFDYTTLNTCRLLVDNGIACVAFSYRRAKGDITAYEAVVDTKDAARFLIENAEKFSLSKKSYGTWGGSAGGHLCLVAALGKDKDFKSDVEAFEKVKTNFSCVVSYCPFTSCLNPDLAPGSIFEDGTRYERLLGGTVEQKTELARMLSPTELLTKKSTPVLLVHGKADKILPVINSEYMFKVGIEKKVDIDFMPVDGAGHSFKDEGKSPTIDEMNDRIIKFIKLNLF